MKFTAVLLVALGALAAAAPAHPHAVPAHALPEHLAPVPPAHPAAPAHPEATAAQKKEVHHLEKKAHKLHEVLKTAQAEGKLLKAKFLVHEAKFHAAEKVAQIKIAAATAAKKAYLATKDKKARAVAKKLANKLQKAAQKTVTHLRVLKNKLKSTKKKMVKHFKWFSGMSHKWNQAEAELAKAAHKAHIKEHFKNMIHEAKSLAKHATHKAENLVAKAKARVKALQAQAKHGHLAASVLAHAKELEHKAILQAEHLKAEAKKLHHAAKTTKHPSHFMSFFHSLRKKMKKIEKKADAGAKKLKAQAKAVAKKHHYSVKKFEAQAKAHLHKTVAKAKTAGAKAKAYAKNHHLVAHLKNAAHKAEAAAKKEAHKLKAAVKKAEAFEAKHHLKAHLTAAEHATEEHLKHLEQVAATKLKAAEHEAAEIAHKVAAITHAHVPDSLKSLEKEAAHVKAEFYKELQKDRALEQMVDHEEDRLDKAAKKNSASSTAPTMVVFVTLAAMLFIR